MLTVRVLCYTRHGDLLFASYTPLSIPATSAPLPPPVPQPTSSTLSGKVVPSEPAPVVAPTTSTARVGGKKPWEEAKEDEVDLYWNKLDGKIERKKGVNGCRCGPKSMCDYCMPLEVSTQCFKLCTGYH